MRSLYFDYNATTPIAPLVQQAVLPFLAEQYGDPSSIHGIGRAARESMEDAREHVSMLLGCDPEELLFTSGGTESNNLAIKGTALAHGVASGGHLVISGLEHASVVEPARFLERLGFDVTIAPVTGQGVVTASAVRDAIRADTILVSVMLANHEIGTVQPLKQIADVCHEAGVPLHTDAVQAMGKLRVNVEELEVDLLSLSGHKMYAPKGVGALYIRQRTVLEPLLHGGGQETGLRAGTENVPGIAGLGAAAVLIGKSLDAAIERQESQRDRLQALLKAGVGDGMVIQGERTTRLPNTLAVSFPGATGRDILARIPEFCAATNTAIFGETECISPTLAAMGVSPDVANATIRLSLGWYTTEDEIERAASLLLGAWEAVVR
jgi:cysteine desulfurase